MANRSLFRSLFGKRQPKTDTLNEAGGRAYQFPPKQALAQYAATGCLSQTFYASDAEQLETVLKLCAQVSPEFIARTALFSRQRGHLKDLPALLCAVLSMRAPGLLCEVFERVIDNGKMLQNFVQIIRSGAVGRRSLGSAPKRLVRRWLETQDDGALLRAAVGQRPSLADIIKMVHPRPATKEREALYGYLIGRPCQVQLLPEQVRRFEAFKNGDRAEVPEVPFQLLTSLELKPREWRSIAGRASWQMIRMNLNTFARHGVFADLGLTRHIAARLRDPEAVAGARVFPYQLMMAYASAGAGVPVQVREALQDAMEIALRNVPAIEGKIYLFPDVSGSMHTPITGQRGGGTTAVRCLDVAALIAAALGRKNPAAEVLPFSDQVVPFRFNPRDSVLTNAERLAQLPSGGTNCSAPLARLNRRQAKGDLLVYVSDNQSWCDSRPGSQATATLEEWARFQARNPQARMACIDLQPNASTQAAECEEILNVGGFSDQVFEVLGAFAAGRLGSEHWVGRIEAVAL